MVERRITQIIQNDLNKKMILLAGPRQSGKTSIARHFVKRQKASYYNWDIEKDRKALLQGQLNAATGLWAFDEIHKYRRWRNWLKGVYDEYGQTKKILVTGSAKLEVYSRGGDSLQGRYFLHRLHPFTLSEVLHLDFVEINDIPHLPRMQTKAGQNTLIDLLQLGGFPEPFLSGSNKEANRWRLSYGTRILREEVISMEKILELDKMELLYQRLPEVIRSPLSINSLREDLEVAFETVANWLSIFENLYLSFRVPPFGPARIKAVKKEQKFYFWDWSRTQDESARLENLVATHLLRLCHWIEDVEGETAELRYLRTRMGHEVDFLVLRSGKPWIAVEVKSKEQSLDPNLKYFLERVQIPWAFQIHLHGENDWEHPSINKSRIRILPVAQFLSQLP